MKNPHGAGLRLVWRSHTLSKTFWKGCGYARLACAWDRDRGTPNARMYMYFVYSVLLSEAVCCIEVFTELPHHCRHVVGGLEYQHKCSTVSVTQFSHNVCMYIIMYHS